MQACFIRHTKILGVSDDDVRRLWTDDQIAIHSATDSQSLDSSTYEINGERIALRRFVLFAEQGGFVWAQYRTHTDVKIGFVEPDTKIIIKDAVWRHNIAGKSGQTAKLKTLQMKQVKTITIDQCKALRAARPRQGTFSLWTKAYNQLESIVKGTRLDHAWKHLSPPQQELVCSEFLRWHNREELPRLKWLSLPTGRTYPDVDICGLATDGRRLVAQVTYYGREHPSFVGKKSNLLKYKTETPHLLMFCRCDQIGIEEGIFFIPVEHEVFKWLEGNPSYASECFSHE